MPVQVAASNELPETEELDALYDRFLIRRQVSTVTAGSTTGMLEGALQQNGVKAAAALCRNDSAGPTSCVSELTDTNSIARQPPDDGPAEEVLSSGTAWTMSYQELEKIR